MSYDLSFTDNFFCPEDFSVQDPPPESDRPTSILQALVSMEEEEYEEMSMTLFNCTNACLEDVMCQVRETNTCSSLDSPVEVWIDEDGEYRIFVYENEEEGIEEFSMAMIDDDLNFSEMDLLD